MSLALRSRGGPRVTTVAATTCLLLAVSAYAQPDLQVAQGLTAINSGDTVDLGDVRVGEQATALFTLRNNGDLPLTFSDPPIVFLGDLTGTAGLIGGTSAPASLSDVAPGGFAVLALVFEVLSPGPVSVRVVIGSNDPDGFLHEIVLQANGLQPAMAASVDGASVASGDTVDLGNLNVGQQVQVDLLVENTGDAALNVQEVLMGLSNDGGAGLDNTVPLAVEAGQSATIPLTLTSVQEGEQVTQVSLLNDSAENPFIIFLRAAGVAPAPPPAPSGPCGGGAAPLLPMILLALTVMKLSLARTPRRG